MLSSLGMLSAIFHHTSIDTLTATEISIQYLQYVPTAHQHRDIFLSVSKNAPPYTGNQFLRLKLLCRLHGGGVPEFFGRPSHYTEGTDFLGTPTDHLDVSLT